MTRIAPLPPVIAGLLFFLLSLSVNAGTLTEVRVVSEAQKYRTIQIEVSVTDARDVDRYEVWFSEQPFRTLTDALLHSQVQVADTSRLERVPEGAAYEDCWEDGLPTHRDPFGSPVISPAAKRWSCQLTGLIPNTDYWIAVVAVDYSGQLLSGQDSLTPIKTRTDIPDQLPAPPDTRPVLSILTSIVICLLALFIYLRRQDMRSGKASANVAHAYVAPALIALAVLSFYPIVYGIWLSFTDAHQSRLGQESFIGLTNFVEVFTSPGFGRVTLFTIIWSVANVTAHVGFGLMLALVLTKAHLKGKLFYRTILLMPWAIPAYISILAWKGILQTDGLFNNILGTEIELLSQVTSAQVLVILVNIWLGIPFMMMSLSGALMAIPRDMYEAADLDGVSKWDQFIHLTLPNLKSTITPLSLLGFIWSFNMFTVIYLITRGNPSVDFGQPGATDILITYVYDVAFDYGRYGVAAAWSVIIFLMLVAFSWVYVKKTKATEAVA